MKEQIGAWEARHQRQFLVDGVRFVDYIQNQWESYQRNKENEKDQRVSESVRRDVTSSSWCLARARAGDMGTHVSLMSYDAIELSFLRACVSLLMTEY